jgi:hypothetical protein
MELVIPDQDEKMRREKEKRQVDFFGHNPRDVDISFTNNLYTFN